MSKEIVIKKDLSPEVKSAGELSFVQDDVKFGTDEVSAADVRISRILLAQKMSPITDKKTSGIVAGDLYDSVTEELTVKEGELFSFVPIHIFKTLTIQQKINGKFEFKESHSWKPEYANLAWEETIAGVEHKNIQNINVLAVKETDLGNPAAFPVIVTFRSSSLNCGKDIIADCLQAKAKGASSAQLTLSVISETKTNDQGTFYIFKKKAPRLTVNYAENKELFKKWNEMFTQGLTKVDDESKVDQQLSGEPFTGQF